MQKPACNVLTIAFTAIALAALAAAQGPPNRGPALVVTAPVESGVLAPQAQHLANVFFKEVSQVATEVAGKVIEVAFEQGQHVKGGQLLVRLDDVLLQKELQAKRAEHQSFAAELEDARTRYARAEKLIADEVTTAQQMDQLRYEVESDAAQLAMVNAQMDRIETLIAKNAIYAPFEGVVLERATELGEWKGAGDTVAVLALDNVYDVVVNVPGRDLKWVQPGDEVTVATDAGNVGGR